MDSAQNENRSEMMDNSLHELFLKGLKKALWMEEALYESLPEMAEGATSNDLSSAFELHHQETARHVEKVKQVFESLSETPEAVQCTVMEALLEEGSALLEEYDEGTMVLDAALIAAAQKIEHHEIAIYGTLASFAALMRHTEAKRLLGEILEEEKAADANLTRIAEVMVNEAAMEER